MYVTCRILGMLLVVVACAGCPITVTILPPEVASAGARWQLDGGVPIPSGIPVVRAATGNHVVSFTDVAGWVTPPNQDIFVDNVHPVHLTGTYTRTVTGGSLRVTIEPQNAIDGGAHWQVDGGALEASGSIVSGLAAGSHTVSFTPVSGWTKPADQTVTIVERETTTATGTYTIFPPKTGSLTVNIEPQGALDAGAQWGVDGGTFRNSGVTVTGLSPGQHTVSFKLIQFWFQPANQVVVIVAGQTTTITGTYNSQLQTGSLTVTIEPVAARTNGAQWRIDAGMYHASGAMVSGLPAGTHTISFSVLPGYIRPLSEKVTVTAGQTANGSGTYTALVTSNSMVVLAYNDLGMHCINQDFSELMVLPPYNVFHATVIAKGEEPRITQSGVTVSYDVPSNTTSVNKTNFWDFAQALFGLPQPLPPDIGLTGNGLAGNMVSAAPDGRTDWVVTGVPITPIDDDGSENAYPLGVVTVSGANGQPIVQTQNVIPVSWEMSCFLCHNTPGITTASDILQAHDRLHGTQLASHKPVVCGSCHAQPPLGLTGQAGRETLSRAMHHAHAPRMAVLGVDVVCYACHPGLRTQCLRDVHFSNGMVCEDCHGDMNAVADPSRLPWQTEPRCSDCHPRSPMPGFELEQPNTLYRNSRGHHGVECEACHGSPHAITPTIMPEDNAQAIALQGHAGKIDTCTVCHTATPDDPFPHSLSGGDK